MKTKLDVVIPQDVLDFIDTIVSKTKGYQVYIGGGYLRDLYYNSVNKFSNLVPKDLDLFFVPINEKGVVQELPVISKTYINYDIPATDIPDMQQRGVARVRGIFVSTLSTTDVQFIVYDKVFLSPDHLAEDMDMNINQIMYNSVSKSFYVSDAFLSGHYNKTIECLHKFDEQRMYNRFKRMKAKFPDYSLVTDIDLESYEKEEKLKPEKYKSSGGSFID